MVVNAPQHLRGLTGTIIEVNPFDVEIKFDGDHSLPFGRAHFNSIILERHENGLQMLTRIQDEIEPFGRRLQKLKKYLTKISSSCYNKNKGKTKW